MIRFIIGPTGCGKTAVGRALAAALGCPFVDADDLHSGEARAKMARGEPLTDGDRFPWLERVRDAAMVAASGDSAHNAVIACSALKRAYRDVLREGAPEVRFIALRVSEAELRRRVERRAEAGGHFMPVSQVADQVRTFEPPGPEEADAVMLDGEGGIREIVDRIGRGV